MEAKSVPLSNSAILLSLPMRDMSYSSLCWLTDNARLVDVEQPMGIRHHIPVSTKCERRHSWGGCRQHRCSYVKAGLGRKRSRRRRRVWEKFGISFSLAMQLDCVSHCAIGRTTSLDSGSRSVLLVDLQKPAHQDRISGGRFCYCWEFRFHIFTARGCDLLLVKQ